MRILQIIPDYGLGGIQKSGCVLALGLKELGNEVMIIGLKRGPRLNLVSEFLRAEVLNTSNRWELKMQLMSFQPELIHIHSATYEDKLIRWLTRNGFKQRIFSTPVFGRPPKNIDLLQETASIFVGLFTLRRAMKWMGLTYKQLPYLGMGYACMTPFFREKKYVPLESHNAILRRISTLKEKGYSLIGRIGRNSVGKWSRKSSRTIDAILTQNNSTAWLSVGMPEELGVSVLSEKWGERFLNINETSDQNFLQFIYEQLDLMVFSSRHGECFSSTICEAMSLGVPVVARANFFKDNGQLEQILGGVTGRIAKSESDISNIIYEIMLNRDSLHKLSLRCRQYARENWDYRVVSGRLLTAYAGWLEDGHLGRFWSEDKGKFADFDSNYYHRLEHDAGATFPIRTLVRVLENYHAFRALRSVKRTWERLAGLAAGPHNGPET